MSESPKASLERKLLAIIRRHAERGEPWRPAALADDVLELAGGASDEERQYLELLGGLSLAAMIDGGRASPEPPNPPV